MMGEFKIGETVLAVIHSVPDVKAVIVSRERGGGWYTVGIPQETPSPTMWTITSGEMSREERIADEYEGWKGWNLHKCNIKRFNPIELGGE
jgi:hypothetical protein